MITCTICDGPFDLDKEGGTAGDLGMIPVALCPTCRAGMFDLFEQMRLPIECPECGWSEGDDE